MIDSDIDLQQKVIGAAIMNEGSCIDMLEIIKTPDVFTDKDCNSFYKAIRELYTNGKVIDYHSVPNEASAMKLGAKNDLYLSVVRFTSMVSGTSKQKQDCFYLLQFYVQRRLQVAGMEISALAGNSSESLELLAIAHDKIEKIDKDIEVEEVRTNEEIFDLVIEDVKQIGKGIKISGHPTGLYDLDRVLGGLQGGQLITLAARPSMGKTALALKIAKTVAGKVGTTLFVSIEMTEEELLKRLAASEVEGLDMTMMFQSGVKENEYDLLEEAKKIILNLPLIIESKSFSLTELIYKIKKYKSRFNLKLVVIDYLQLMNGFEGKNYGGGSSAETGKITDITRNLKQLAKALDIPIVLLSQLNREVEKRPDKRPQLSDLRQSGSIEEDSNTVLLLYRPEFYDMDTFTDGSSSEGLCEIIIPKNRSGKTGSVMARYVGNKTAFYDVETKFDLVTPTTTDIFDYPIEDADPF